MASTRLKTKPSQTPKLVLPWMTRISIYFLSKVTDNASRSNGTVNRRLMNFFDRKSRPNATPVNGVSTKDVTVDANLNLWFRVFTPADGGCLPVVVFFHGGGFAFLSPDSFAFDAVCRRFCQRIPAVVVSVNYRLTPEHRYPSQYDDGEAVLKFLDENRAVLPEVADLSKCFLAGDSAGANLAHNVAVRVAKSGLRSIRVVGLISIQPWFGGEERTEAEVRLEGAPLVSMRRTDWLWKAFLPDGSDRDHAAVNVSGANAVDLSGLDYPDTLVFVGGFDPLQDWQKRYYEWLIKSGKKAQLIPYPTMIHVNSSPPPPQPMPASTKPILPWKLRLKISVLSFFMNASRRSNGTVNRRLFNFFERKVPSNANPVDGVTTSDVTVDPARNLWFRLFVPSAAASLPVVVFFPGGGFAFLSPDSAPLDAACRFFCRSFNAVIVSVNYRLAPEHRYPSQYDDGFDVVNYLDQNGAVLDNIADVNKCFLVGDSSGGNIAHHVAVRVCKEKLGLVKIIGLVSIEPFFGGKDRTESEIRLTQDPLISLEITDWFWKAFLPNGSDRDHEAANVSGPNAVDISGLDYPNTLIVVAGFDPLKDWQRKYYEWLRKSGMAARIIEYPNMIHGFHLFPDLPDTSLFVSDVKDFIAKQVAR
ncbi:putative carboxylesterase 18, partial [Mucuna pruriens]